MEAPEGGGVTFMTSRDGLGVEHHTSRRRRPAGRLRVGRHAPNNIVNVDGFETASTFTLAGGLQSTLTLVNFDDVPCAAVERM